MDGYIFPNESEFQWSILIVLYPFITGLVAGAFVVSSLYHVFGMKSLRPVARLALITALAFLLIAPLPLQAHLGHPERAFLIFLTPHFTSAMAGFGYIWMFYLVLVVVETWLVFRPDIVALAQRTRWPLSAVYRSMALGVDDVSEEALEVDRTLIKVLAAVGIPAAALLHGYVGFIFGAIKANPWWSTPLMPIIFLLSAIVSGIALLIVIYVLAMKLLEREIDHDCVRAMGGLLAAFLFIDLTLEGLEILSMAYEQEESWEVVSGLIDRIFVSFVIVQVLLGAVIPLVVLGYLSLGRVGKGLSTTITTLIGAMVVVGVFAMRWNVVVGGQMISKSLRGYVEYEWIFGGREGVYMAALILCLPLAAFVTLATLLPPWVPATAVAADSGPRAGAPGVVMHGQVVLALRGEQGAQYLDLLGGSPPKRYLGMKLAIAGLAATMGALLFGVLTAPGSPRLLERPGSSPERVLVPQFRTSFPATLLARFTEPVGGSWVEPLDLTVMGDRVFVLDHAGEQVVEIDLDGAFIRSFSAATVPGLDIHHPHTMGNDGTFIYIGNTFPPRVYVLNPATSTLERSIVLPAGLIDGLPAVPTGMALNGEGNIVVADGQNHRLIIVTPEGDPVRVVDRPSGSWDLFKPGNINIAPETAEARVGPIATTGRPGSVGITADGTILALDILGPGVMRVHPDGTLATTFARPSDPVGGVFDPTDIIVDAEGRIFVSDELIHGIQVYDRTGTPLGVIGRSDPNNFTEPVDMARPSALALRGDKLYVIDRGKGVVVYQLPSSTEAVAP